MAESKPPKIDYDALFKDFVTHRFQDFLDFAIPSLYVQVDWHQPPEFLEQELINALRGKYKQRGKRRHTDKLVKVSLLSGEARLVYIHIEFQHEPETDFALRMFEYMMRIRMKYDTRQITAVAVFSGAPPPASALVYQEEISGTTTSYQFNTIITAHQDDAALIASKNSFALALLAAKYAYEAREDGGRLFMLKRKVLELSLKSGVDKDVIMETFIFVKEFMTLPEETERLLEQQLEETMGTTTLPPIKVSEGTKRFAERIYAAAHEGKLPSEVMEEELKRVEEEAARQLEAEHQRAQEVARQLEAEHQRAQEEAARLLEAERRRTEATIVRMSKQLAMPTAQIAIALDVSVEVVEEVLLRHLGE